VVTQSARLCDAFWLLGLWSSKMDWLTKCLFPNNPRMVRYRKLEVMYIVLFLVLAVCATVGVMIFMISTESSR